MANTFSSGIGKLAVGDQYAVLNGLFNFSIRTLICHVCILLVLGFNFRSLSL